MVDGDNLPHPRIPSFSVPWIVRHLGGRAARYDLLVLGLHNGARRTICRRRKTLACPGWKRSPSLLAYPSGVLVVLVLVVVIIDVVVAVAIADGVVVGGCGGDLVADGSGERRRGDTRDVRGGGFTTRARLPPELAGRRCSNLRFGASSCSYSPSVFLSLSLCLSFPFFLTRPLSLSSFLPLKSLHNHRGWCIRMMIARHYDRSTIIDDEGGV